MNSEPRPSRNASLFTIAGLAAFTALPLLFCSRSKKERHGWIDITPGLDPRRIPTYEGNVPLKVEWTSTLQKDGVNLSRYSMGSHTGAHVDAPLHFIEGGTPIDRIDLDKLTGPALVLDVPEDVDLITAAVLKRLRWKGASRILFKTRNTAYRLMETPTFHKNYVALAPDAAQVLAQRKVGMVGVDYLSVQPYGRDTATHRILLGSGVLVVEGLNLAGVAPGEYDLLVLPLKVVGHEAAPARALLRKR